MIDPDGMQTLYNEAAQEWFKGHLREREEKKTAIATMFKSATKKSLDNAANYMDTAFANAMESGGMENASPTAPASAGPAEDAQQGEWDLWGKGSVPYDGKALGGTNFIGPGPDVEPRTLGMRPIDEIDKGAFYHDIKYFENRTGGVKGALFNQNVKGADLALALTARSIIERYQSGTNNIDAVTGLPISERTYNLAIGVWTVFAPITQMKYLKDGYIFPPGGLYNPPATPPARPLVSMLLLPFYAP